MTLRLSRSLRSALLAARVLALMTCASVSASPAQAQEPQQSQPTANIQQSRTPAAMQRIPRQLALQTSALDGSVTEAISSSESRPIPAAQLTLINLATHDQFHAPTNSEGIFRVIPIAPGNYELHIEAETYAPLSIPGLNLNANEVLTLQISLTKMSILASSSASRLPRQPELGPPSPSGTEQNAASPYRILRHRLDSDPHYNAEPT